MISKARVQILVLIFGFLWSPLLLAWGNRGHAVVCEAATFLVPKGPFSDLLKTKRLWINHLCNVPDIYWKQLPDAQRAIGDPTHYLNPENAGLTVEQIPRAFADYKNKKSGVPDKELGSLWWRAQQFFDLAAAQAANFPDVKSVNLFLTYIGIMGHFLGDASVPYHSSADYDGFKTGRGGIHSHYEDKCVDELGPDLLAKVVAIGKTQKRPPGKDLTAYDWIRWVTIASAKEKVEVEKLDHPKVASTGSDSRTGTKAVRAEPNISCKGQSRWIEKEMARSAFALAETWQLAFAKAKDKALDGYQSYDFPFQPEFILPDYLIK